MHFSLGRRAVPSAKRSIVFSLFALTLPFAQGQALPVFSEGDSWTYRYTEEGSFRWVYTETVSRIDGPIADLDTMDDRGRRTIATYDLPTQRYLVRYVWQSDGTRGRQLTDFSSNSPPLVFPLSIGSKWQVTYRFGIITQVFDAKVVGLEAIKTAAGEFETYKVELNGFWINEAELGFGARGRQIETYWYAPLVKRYVRREIRTYGVSAQRSTAALQHFRADELISYKLAS